MNFSSNIREFSFEINQIYLVVTLVVCIFSQGVSLVWLGGKKE